MNASELARRQPVWLVLSEFYLNTELQPADFKRIKAVFDQSGYSPQKIRQLDYDEAGPLLLTNLLSVAGEWAGLEETTLLAVLAKRATSSAKLTSLLPLKRRWRKRIDCYTNRHFQRVVDR